MKARASERHAFTLIELLVVIAIIMVLVSLLLTGLAHMKRVGNHTRENAGGAQLNLAYLTYANDNRDAVMPGVLRTIWAQANQDPAHQFWVWDDRHASGTRLEGNVIMPYPWRIAPYLDYNTRGLVLDKQLWEEFNALDADAPSNPYAVVFSQYPSFGLNSAYVGGDHERGGFRPAPLRRLGRFYVTKASEALFPSKLIIFSTARGSPTGSRIIPGWYRIDAPVTLDFEGLHNVRWTSPDVPVYNPDSGPMAYGCLDLRHFRQAITTHFDGHCELQALAPLRDMTRWSNQADRADWEPH